MKNGLPSHVTHIHANIEACDLGIFCENVGPELK